MAFPSQNARNVDNDRLSGLMTAALLSRFSMLFCMRMEVRRSDHVCLLRIIPFFRLSEARSWRDCRAVFGLLCPLCSCCRTQEFIPDFN